MTIALGILCQGGAVLAADSQETSLGYWKRRQTKIAAHTIGASQDLVIAMAGAGRSGYIDALIDHLLNAVIPADGNWHKSLKIIKKDLIDFHHNHVAPYTADPPETPLVFVMQKGQHLASLYTTDRSTIAQAKADAAAVGIGAGHALSILNRTERRPHELTMNAAIALAAYVVHHTKHHVADCGDVTNVIAMRDGETEMVPERSLKALDLEFDHFMDATEPSIVEMLVGTREVDSAGIGAALTRASKAIAELASERMVLSGEEIYAGTEPGDGE